MTMGENQTTEARGGKYAERFTPAVTVLLTLLQPHFIDEGKPLRGLDKTLFDECCGQGQFSCAILVLKIFYNCLAMPPPERPQAILRILRSIFAMDIQEKSCAKAKEHLILTVIDSYKWFFGEEYPLIAEATSIIEEIVQCGNVLEFLFENTPPENRDAEYYASVKDMAKRGRISSECAERIFKAKDKQQTLF